MLGACCKTLSCADLASCLRHAQALDLPSCELIQLACLFGTAADRLADVILLLKFSHALSLCQKHHQKQAVMGLQHLQVKLFVELFSSKFQGPFFKALRSENDEQLMEAAKSLEYGLEV